MPASFQTFELLIEPVGEAYRARVLRSPAGSASVEFSLPFSDLELENLFLRLEQPRRGVRRIESPAMEAVRVFGGRLFQNVFKDDLLACWQSSLAVCKQQGQGLRLLLRLGEAPRLAALPWEFLYNEELNRFYALSRQTPVVRYLVDFPESVPPLEVEPPLNMLVVLASPEGFPPLDVEAEWGILQKALERPIRAGRLKVRCLSNATVSQLQHRLRRDPVHILHFVGHGGYDAASEDGVLLFEDDRGNAQPLTGQYLGALLQDSPTLRLVMLNACEGGRSSWRDPFSGVAQSLIQQGIPAVVAMQFAISDQAALLFSREFYASVADGYLVTASLSDARKAMFAETQSPAWGTPVLYLRTPQDRIFRLPPPPPTTEIQSAEVKAVLEDARKIRSTEPTEPVKEEAPTQPIPQTKRVSRGRRLVRGMLVLLILAGLGWLATQYLPVLLPEVALPWQTVPVTATAVYEIVEHEEEPKPVETGVVWLLDQGEWVVATPPAETALSELLEAIPSTDRSYVNYYTVSDEKRWLQLDLPKVWGDVSSSWQQTPDTGEILAYVKATTDLKAFEEEHSVSGAYVVVASKAQSIRRMQVDARSGVTLSGECRVVRGGWNGTLPEKGLDRAYLYIWEDCAKSATYETVAVFIGLGSDFSVTLEVHVLEHTDWEALARAIQTLRVTGPIP